MGSIIIGTNKNAGGYTNLEMGITAQSGGDAYVQSISNSGSSYGSLLLNLFGGNVGIGTSSTTQKLTVAGNTAISGTIGVGSNAAIVGNVTVNSGKGIVRSNDGIQLKTVLFETQNSIALINYVNGNVGCLTITYDAFSSPPRISISDTEGITNANNLLITVNTVTTTSAIICIRNVGNQTVLATNSIIRAIFIGPQ